MIDFTKLNAKPASCCLSNQTSDIIQLLSKTRPIDMTSTETNNLIELLTPFGLEKDEVRVFVELVKKGSLTALQLSRNLKIGRTKVYRILRDLKKYSLVSTQAKDYGKKFQASSIENLKLLVDEKKQKYEMLKNSLPQALNLLSKVSNEDLSKSKVLHYSGKSGLKQVIWNQKNAKRIIRTFVSKEMSEYIDYGIGDEVRIEFVKNRVKIKELRNEKHIPNWTNVVEIVKRLWEVKYISPKELEMEFEFVVYNDVTAMYGLDGSDLFCVEIYNEKTATMMKKMFDFLFKHARKMEIVNEHGEAKLEE